MAFLFLIIKYYYKLNIETDNMTVGKGDGLPKWHMVLGESKRS
jgi:hypothetical protein